MKHLISTLFICISFNLSAQVLEQYVVQGLQNNLALQQKEANYKKSVLALKEAKALFYPNISLNARYSVADGGRVIDFPLGDLLNPVYENINNLYKLQGIPVDAPVVLENESYPFLRPTEHETKLRLTQPIYNPQIYFNRKIKQELSDVQYIDVESYKRELTGDIKSAYFNYLMSMEYLSLLNETKELLKENLRVNKSMYENNKVTIDHVYRSETEISKLDKEIAEASQSNQNAKAYFNFLLNRSLDEAIDTSASPNIPLSLPPLSELKTKALENRQELSLMDYYFSANEYNIQMQKFNKSPTISAVVDYGYQGEEYDFSNNNDFVMASFVLTWDIFKGFQNNSKIQQATIERDILNSRRKEIENQIMLQVSNAYYDLMSAKESLVASSKEGVSANKGFEIVDKQYNEGMVNLLQYLDARNTKTNASKKFILSKYNLWIKYIELEKLTGIELIYE